jgi:hypothetical protein
MPWPMQADYQDALQNPSSSFSDPELKRSKPQTTPIGLPFIRAGQFAGVCKFTNGEMHAVRCFFLEQQDRHRRYDVVSKYLDGWRKQHKQNECPIVTFKYLDQGIRLGRTWYPILKMKWVDGETLFRWCKTQVDRLSTSSFRALADQWVQLVQMLQSGKIAHGDLQHGNIMVAANRLFLVDYDCMGVPALFGQPSLENGLPAYQHKSRNGCPLSPQMDDFSALVILVALRALAVDLSLWTTFVENTDNENILFQKEDLADPKSSALFRALLRSPDGEVMDWARALMDAAVAPLDQVPRFEDLIDVFRGIRRRVTQFVQAKDWESIVAEAASPRIAGKALPPDIKPNVEKAHERVAARQSLIDAIRGSSLRAICQAGKQSKLLEDWPAAQKELAELRRAQQIEPLVTKLEQKLQTVTGRRELAALWDQNSSVAGCNYIEVERIRKDLPRIRTTDAMLVLTKATPISAIKIADVWDKLQGQGGHPDAEPVRALAIQSVRQRDCIRQLESLASKTDEGTDRRFANIWSDPLLQGCDDAKHLSKRCQEVRDRLSKLAAMESVIANVDAGRQAESAVVQSAAALAASYPHKMLARVQIAQRRISAAEAVKQAVNAVPVYDMKIAEAWDEVVRIGGEREASPSRDRASLAIRRRERIKQLGAVPASASEENDRKFVDLWDETLLGQCPDANRCRSRLDSSKRRLATLERLAEVIRRVDAAQAAEVLIVREAGPIEAGYQHRWAARVKQAEQRARALVEFDAAIARSPQSDRAIATAWDGVLKDNAQAGVSKEQWTRAELAKRRLARLVKLDQIAEGNDLDHDQNERWIELCDEAFLAECTDARAYGDRYRKAVERHRFWTELERALDLGDDIDICRHSKHPLLQGYSRVRENNERIADACKRGERAAAILDCLESNDKERFSRQFDAEVFRLYPPKFQPQMPKVREWVQTLVLSNMDCESTTEPFASLEGVPGQYAVKWKWPRAGTISYCLITASRKGFPGSPSQAERHNRVTRFQFEQANRGTLLVPRDWMGLLYVTVWPGIDLGPEVVWGKPLNVGQFRLRGTRPQTQSEPKVTERLWDLLDL